MYYLKAEGTVVKTIYEYIGAGAKALNVHHTVINNHLRRKTNELRVGLKIIIYLVVNWIV